MSRYRLVPSRAQEEILLRHCSDDRYVWNLCVEQESWRRRGRGRMPGFAERCRQLTKASGRVEKVPAAYTSQRCPACGHVARDNRESQAVFLCTACGYAVNADVNADRNIAAGHAVNARGGDRAAGPVNREPQLGLLAS